jgi:hypothetical protein
MVQDVIYDIGTPAAPPPPVQPKDTSFRGAARLRILYQDSSLTFDPLDPERAVKLGFVAKPCKILLRLNTDAARDYREYKLWGPLIGEGVWKTLPNATEDGFFEITAALTRKTVLAGDTAQPFSLSNGMTLVIATATAAATYAEETVTFNTGSFADMGVATAAEVAAVINAQATNVTAAAIEGRVSIESKVQDSFLQLASPDDADYLIGFEPENRSTIYHPFWRGNSSRYSRIYCGVRKEGESGAHEVAWDWIVRDEVAPVLPSDVRKMEWFGVPLVAEDGRAYTDEQLWHDLLATMDDLERETRVRLTPMRVWCEPELRSPKPRLHFDYDMGESAYDYDWRSARQFWHTQLREYPVLSVEEFAFRSWDNKVVADFKSEVKLYGENGQVKLVPSVPGSAAWLLIQTGSMALGVSPYQTLPKWIWIRYTAGPRGGVLKHDAIDSVRKAAWIRVARIVSDAIARGLTSVSISDGAVSQSKSTAGSSQTVMLGGRIAEYERVLAAWKETYRDREKGPTLVFL